MALHTFHAVALVHGLLITANALEFIGHEDHHSASDLCEHTVEGHLSNDENEITIFFALGRPEHISISTCGSEFDHTFELYRATDDLEYESSVGVYTESRCDFASTADPGASEAESIELNAGRYAIKLSPLEPGEHGEFQIVVELHRRCNDGDNEEQSERDIWPLIAGLSVGIVSFVCCGLCFCAIIKFRKLLAEAAERSDQSDAREAAERSDQSDARKPMIVKKMGEEPHRTTTPGQYRYVQWFELDSTVNSTIFLVDAIGDARIALGANTEVNEGNYWEILLGRKQWDAVIRKGIEGKVQCSTIQKRIIVLPPPDLDSGLSFLSPVWISWDSHLCVGKGFEVGSNELMRCEFDEAIPVRFMSICTGSGLEREWVINQRRSPLIGRWVAYSGTVDDFKNEEVAVISAEPELSIHFPDGEMNRPAVMTMERYNRGHFTMDRAMGSKQTVNVDYFDVRKRDQNGFRELQLEFRNDAEKSHKICYKLMS